MVKVRVTKPWDFKVKVGDEFTMKFLHPSLASHVVVLDEWEESEEKKQRKQKGEATLEVATPSADTVAE